MKYISRAFLFFFLLPFNSLANSVVPTSIASPAQQQQNISITTSEGVAMKTLRTLFSAEATYQNTAGNGEYGNMKELREAGMIDKELASGVKHDYRFTIVIKKSTLIAPPAFDLVARPTKYGKDTRRSFYMTESGILLTSDEKDAALTSMRPFATGSVGSATPTSTAAKETIDAANVNGEEGTSGEITANEMAVITTLRAIHSAQKEYSTKIGAGTYGTLDQLEKSRLIDSARAASEQHGYLLAVAITAGKPESPAMYSISAIPQAYGGSGRRSFFIDQTGVLRGADKEGGSSDQSDPTVEK